MAPYQSKDDPRFKVCSYYVYISQSMGPSRFMVAKLILFTHVDGIWNSNEVSSIIVVLSVPGRRVLGLLKAVGRSSQKPSRKLHCSPEKGDVSVKANI